MRSYDDWRTAAPEMDEEPPTECPVCTGHASASPCSEECDALVKRCERERLIKVLYENARHALRRAREYREEEPSNDDHRVRAILHRVGIIRADICELRRAS